MSNIVAFHGIGIPTADRRPDQALIFDNEDLMVPIVADDARKLAPRSTCSG
jgi:hypothetical protein